MKEYDFEPIKGLPGSLPKGEKILWQGAPKWWSFATHIFHVRLVIAYFLLLMVWRIAEAFTSYQTLTQAVVSVLWLAPVAAVALGLLMLLAWAFATTTIYTITNRRIVMRYGVAIPMAINLPFRKIESASCKTHQDGTGDIPVVLNGNDRFAYLHLWPNARPWTLAKAQPMIRSVPNGAKVANILATALSAYHHTQMEKSATAAHTAVASDMTQIKDTGSSKAENIADDLVTA